jgi:hypothetical protein
MRPPSVRLAVISLTALHSLAIAKPLSHRVESSQANLSDPWEQNLSRQPDGAATPFNGFGRNRESLSSLFIILSGQVGQLGQAPTISRLLASNLAGCTRTGGPAYSVLALKGDKVARCHHPTLSPAVARCSTPSSAPVLLWMISPELRHRRLLFLTIWCATIPSEKAGRRITP